MVVATAFAGGVIGLMRGGFEPAAVLRGAVIAGTVAAFITTFEFLGGYRLNRARFSFALARILIYGLLIAAEGRPIYLAEFGYAPRFRAALHVGPVIAGELGDMRQEIVFLGDTMNTAARIEQACREHPARCLASAAVLADLDLSLGITADKVGSLLLHGKERPVERFSLSIR